MQTNKHPVFSARVSVEITEFGDFTCPQSRQVRGLIDEVADLFKDSVTHRYRHYPNLNNNESLLAAVALEAAKRQGQFRPLYNGLLTQSTINCNTLLAQASVLALDQRQFMKDLMSDCIHDVVKKDWLAGYALGVHHAPTLFVNGHRFYGKLTLSRLAPFVRFSAVQTLKVNAALQKFGRS